MKRLAVFLLLPLLLGGCAKKETPQGPLCRVVTEIRVVATIDGQTYLKTYTAPEQMHSALNYLRLLQKGKRADIDPDSFRSDSYEITVFYSDGQRTRYHQLHTDYLKIDDGHWQTIEGAKMELLFP